MTSGATWPPCTHKHDRHKGWHDHITWLHNMTWHNHTTRTWPHYMTWWHNMIISHGMTTSGPQDKSSWQHKNFSKFYQNHLLCCISISSLDTETKESDISFTIRQEQQRGKWRTIVKCRERGIKINQWKWSRGGWWWAWCIILYQVSFCDVIWHHDDDIL